MEVARALIKYKAGDIIGAIEDLNIVIELKKDLSDAYYQRGSYLYQLGKKDEACSDYKTGANYGHAYAKQLFEKYCKEN